MLLSILFCIFAQNYMAMDNNKLIDGAEIITLDEIKHLKLPYFEGLAAGYPSPAGDYQHESLDLNEKFVQH